MSQTQGTGQEQILPAKCSTPEGHLWLSKAEHADNLDKYQHPRQQKHSSQYSRRKYAQTTKSWAKEGTEARADNSLPQKPLGPL